jgi:ectoine hydroxylase-related dioxygenase (phytanoyl-CoA dioxygenase family)
VDVIPLPAPGEVLLFSGAQLHTSIPNTSGLARYSVDFRTVNTTDLHAGLGAPVVDADCTGTAIRDFVSTKDESAFDEEAVRSIYGAPPTDALLVFGGPSGKR